MARQRIVDAQPAMGDGLNDVSDDLALLPTQLRLAINARLTEYGAVTKRGGTQRAHLLPLGVGALPSAAFTEDFSTYADWSAFDSFLNAQPYTGGQLFAGWQFSGTPGPYGNFDAGNPFNGIAPLAADLDSSNTFWYLLYSDWDTSTGEGVPDLTYFMLYEVSSNFSPPETTLQSNGQNNFALAFLNFAETDGSGPFDEGYLIVYDDTVWWVWYDSGASTFSSPVSVGPLSDFVGSTKQLLIRSQTVGAVVTTRLYLSAPSPTPVLYATFTNSTTRANGGLSRVQIAFRAGGASPDGTIWVHQLAMDTNASVFGL